MGQANVTSAYVTDITPPLLQERRTLCSLTSPARVKSAFLTIAHAPKAELDICWQFRPVHTLGYRHHLSALTSVCGVTK